MFKAKVIVNRGRGFDQILQEITHHKYIDTGIEGTVPLIAGQANEEVELELFPIYGDKDGVTDKEVEMERQKRGLIRDIAAQAQYNINHPQHGKNFPNIDSWLDKDGNWCSIIFGRRFPDGISCVYVRKFTENDKWPNGIYAAGVRPAQSLAE